MIVQVHRAQECRLTGVRVDPSQGEEVVLHLELEDGVVVGHGARVGGACLLRDEHVGDGEHLEEEWRVNVQLQNLRQRKKISPL